MNDKIEKWHKHGKFVVKIMMFSCILFAVFLLLDVFSSFIIFFFGIWVTKLFNFVRNFSFVTLIASVVYLLYIKVIRIPLLNNKANILKKEYEENILNIEKQTVATNALNEKSVDLYFQINDLLKQPGDSGMHMYLEETRDTLSMAEKRYKKIKDVLIRSDQIDALREVLVTVSQSLDDIYNAVNKVINRVIIYEDDSPEKERMLHINHVKRLIDNMNDITEKMGDLTNETLIYMELKNVDASTLAIEALIEVLSSLHKKIMEN